MEKLVKSKLTRRFILIGIIPAVLLALYFTFFSSGKSVTGKPNTPNVLQSEKNSAVSLTARNSWYLTMILRKVEFAGRMAGEVTTGVFKRQNSFFTQDDYRKIKTDAGGKFLWNPEKEAGVLFVCGGYKAVSKDGKVPVIGAYLDNALTLVEKNGTVIDSTYIMTESALRKFPWAKVDDLVKTGLFKVGNYKVKADVLFSSEDASPFRIAGPDLNKSRMEVWTEAYWSQESKSWMISYFMPLYVDGVYKGVLGADISLQKLLEKLIGKDQAKKFTYADTFPAVITKNGVLVSSSIYGYEMFKLDSVSTAQADLKSYGNDGFKSSLSRVLDSKFWDNATRDEELGGIESVSVNKKDYYLAHFPVRTGGLTLALFIPAVNLEKSAALSVTTGKTKSGGINPTALILGLLAVALSVALMIFLVNDVAKNTGSLSEEGATARAEELSHKLFEEKKKGYDDKLWEFGERNTDLTNQLEKTKKELNEALIARSSSVAAPDLSKYVLISEVNLKIENERKTLVAKLGELENTKNDLERKLSEKTAEYRKLIMQPGPQNSEPDPSKYLKIEQFNAKLESERKNFISKVNELEKSGTEAESRLKETKLEKAKLEELLAEARKNSSSLKGGNDQGLVQRLGEVQKANDGFKDNFEKLKRENEELLNKVKTLENEGRKLAEMLLAKFDEEKKAYNQKVEELNKQVNVGASRVVELENKIKTDSVKLAQMDPSKFVPLSEVNTRIESDRKNYILKIQELENSLKTAIEKPDPAQFVPLSKVNEERAVLEKAGKDKVADLETKLSEVNTALGVMKELQEKNRVLEEKLTEATTLLAGAKQLEVKLAEVSLVADGARKLEEKDRELEAKQNELSGKLLESGKRLTELQTEKARELEAKQKENQELNDKLQDAEKQINELRALKEQTAAKDKELELKQKEASELSEKVAEYEKQVVELKTLRELTGAKDGELQEKQKLLAELEEKSRAALKESEESFGAKLKELEQKVKEAEEKPVDENEYMPVDKVADLVSERLEAQDQKYAGRIKELEQALKAEKEKPAADLTAYVAISEVEEKVNAEKKAAQERLNQLELAVKALNQEKSGLAAQLAEGASSREAVQKVMATVGEATKKMEEEKQKAAVKVRELETIKTDLEQKYMLLMNENKKMVEALNVVEGRKKETDKQAQSLIMKVGEDQRDLKVQLKELTEQNGKLTAERDAARKHYEIMRKELEKEQEKPAPSLVFEKPVVEEEQPKKKEDIVIERNAASKPELIIEEPKKEKPVEKVVKEKEVEKPQIQLKTPVKQAPLSALNAPPPVAPSSSPEHSEEEENNLLVVDDKGEIIKTFGDSLYNMGYSVYIARNIKLAKQKLTMGNYRNVILSVNMTDEDYKEFFESVKKGDAKFAERIVFYNNDDSKDKAFLSGKKIMKASTTEADIKKMMT